MKKLITKMLAVLLAVSSINMQADAAPAPVMGQAACALSNSQSNLCAILGGSVGGVGGLVITIVGILKFVPLNKIGSFFSSLQNLANNASLSAADKALLNTLQEIHNNSTYKMADSKAREVIIKSAIDKYNLRNILIEKNVNVEEDEIDNFVKEATRNSRVVQRLSDAFTKKELTNNLATIFSNEIKTLNNLSKLKAERSWVKGKLNEEAVDEFYDNLPVGKKYSEDDLFTEMIKNLKFHNPQELKNFIEFAAQERFAYSEPSYEKFVGNYLAKRAEVKTLAQDLHVDVTTGQDVVGGHDAVVHNSPDEIEPHFLVK